MYPNNGTLGADGSNAMRHFWRAAALIWIMPFWHPPE
jgi:hypothetical protein